MKILIVDNEAPIRSSLVKMVKHFLGDTVEIIEAAGVREGYEKINLFDPEILVLDIEMDDGNGFDLLRLIPEPRFQLIFTTAHNQYAVRAFEFCAINYLMKPVSPSALNNTLQKAIKNINQKDLQQQISILLAKESTAPLAEDQKMVLKDNQGIYFVKIRDIFYCESDGPYTKFVIKQADSITVSKHLKEYEDLLSAYHFIRCHHSYLVNALLVSRLDKTEGGHLVLSNGIIVPVSQRKKEFVIEYLENLHANKKR